MHYRKQALLGCHIATAYPRVLGADVSRVSNYMRSSSPEFDDVVLSDHSDEDEEYSEEIPVEMEHLKSRDEDSSLNRDKRDVLFDDSESDEFSIPQVDWACVNALSPGEAEVNSDGTLPLGDDKAGADADGPCLSAGLDTARRCRVTNTAVTSNATNDDESDNYLEVCEGDTSLSEGLTFNIASVSHLEEETTLLHEGSGAAEETPTHSASRLSRKRSRVSRSDSGEQGECKRLCHNVDDVPAASGSVAEAVLPTLLQNDNGSDAGYDDLLIESGSEANSASQPSSSATETTVISMFSQDCDVSFSQGM